jgi:Methyltransferase domain
MRGNQQQVRSGRPLSVPLLTGVVLVSLGSLLHQNVRQSLSFRLTTTTTNPCDYPDASFSHNSNYDPYRQAREESLGYFDDISDADWELMRNITLGRFNNANPRQPLGNSRQANHWYQMNWDPDFSCRHDTKIGVGDGGKVGLVCLWSL